MGGGTKMTTHERDQGEQQEKVLKQEPHLEPPPSLYSPALTKSPNSSSLEEGGLYTMMMSSKPGWLKMWSRVETSSPELMFYGWSCW